MSSKDRVLKSVFLVTVLSVIGKITGFFREASIAAYYGAGTASDAYFVAYTLPSILFFIIGASMGVIFVPMYLKQLKRDEKSACNFASNILNITLLITLVFTVLGIIFSRYVVMIIAPGFKHHALDMASRLTRILFPTLIFISLSCIVTGVLQSHKSFAVPAMVSIPSNLIMILGTVLFSEKYGIYALGWATVLGAAAQLAIQLPSVRKKLDYRFYVKLDDTAALEYWKLIIPVILSTAVGKINEVVDKMLASSLAAGSISAINYSTKLLDFVYGICLGAVIMVIYPTFAGTSVSEDYDSLAHTTYDTIVGVTQMILPVIAVTVMLREDIVRLIFERGTFEKSYTALTAYALLYYAPGLWATGIREVINRVFYSLGDSGTPMKVSIGAVAVNIALSVLLVRNMEIGGLGLAASLSGTMAVLILLYLIGKRMDGLNLKGMVRDGLKISAAVLFMLYVMSVYRNWVRPYNSNIAFASSAGIGMVIYAGISWIFGIGLFRRFKLSGRYSDITDIETSKIGRYVPVSVIIPCYMCDNTVARAVSSVWNQTWRPGEVILVGDYSSGGSAVRKSIKQLVRLYPRRWIKVVYLKEGCGRVNGRNAGWKFATREYVAFLDPDDAWHPQKVEVQLKLMLKNLHVSISGHKYGLVKGSINKTYTLYTQEYFKKIKVTHIKNIKKLLYNPLPVSSVMIRRNDISDGLYKKKLDSEDYFQWLGTVLSGHKAMKINMPLCYIYQDNEMGGPCRKLWTMYKEQLEIYKALHDKELINPLSLEFIKVLSYIKFIGNYFFILLLTNL